MITPTIATCEECGHEEHPQMFDVWTAEQVVVEDESDATTFRGYVRIVKTLHCPACGSEVAAAEPEPIFVERTLQWA